MDASCMRIYHRSALDADRMLTLSDLLLGTFDELIKLACVLMKRRKRTSKDILPYECAVSDAQARW